MGFAVYIQEWDTAWISIQTDSAFYKAFYHFMMKFPFPSFLPHPY